MSPRAARHLLRAAGREDCQVPARRAAQRTKAAIAA